ncbi:MAG: PIG-L deacetylase family protein [Spirochaetia bacterium]|jgi:LmbE family N-acetylglucosaminyl deacetylase
MKVSLLAYEVIGHTFVMTAFLVMVVYVLGSRRILRRSVRRAAPLFWFILAVGVVSSFLNLTRLVSLISRGVGIPASVLDVASEYVSMIGLSIVVILLIGLRVIAERKDVRPWRILVVGAHPDDIEIACGAAMARMHDTGHVIWGLVMTQGEQGGDSSVRPGEARKGANFLGLDSVRVCDFPDTRLSEQAVPLITAIEEQIALCKPDMIFTHSLHDLHQDHRAVHEATLRAARNHDTIFCYESPSVTQEFVPTFFVDVSDYIDVKIESIKEHWDQRGKPYVQSERVKGVAVFRGGQAKLRYAEAFEVVRASFSRIG